MLKAYMQESLERDSIFNLTNKDKPVQMSQMSNITDI